MSYGYAQPHQYTAYPAAPAYQQPRRTAPPSVHTVAFLQYLGGLIQLAAAAAVVLLPTAGLVADANVSVDPARLTQATYAVAALLTVGALISLTIGRKLQRGRQWARVLIILVSLLPVAAVATQIALTGDPTGALGLLGPALYLLLLNTRAARSWFRHHTW
jgi:peptidoglycan/LPS O-acetylase OafA/YrhL